MSIREEIERIFAPWLTWSRDEEILVLLDLVVATLRKRGFQVNVEINHLRGGGDHG